MSSFSQKIKRIARNFGHSRVNLTIKLTTSVVLFVFLLCVITYTPFTNTNHSDVTNTPRASIRTITGNITLSSLSTTTATYGDDVTLYGHAENWNDGTFTWIPYVGEIYLVVDDGAETGITTNSDGSGNFELTFSVENDWSATSDVKIEANTSQGGYDTFCYDQLYLDVDATAVIEIDDNLRPGLEGQIYENYPIFGDVILNSGEAYSGPAFEIEFWYGDIATGLYYRNITVAGDGSFNDFVQVQTLYTFYTLHWDGDSDVLGNTHQFDFHTINDIEVTWTLPTRIYVNETYSFSFDVHQDTDDTVPLAGSNITVYLTGPGMDVNTSIILSAAGSTSFSVEFLVEGSYTLVVVVNYYTSEFGDESVVSWTDQTTFTVQVATAFSDFPWQFVVIGVGAVGVIIGIFFLQRWLMKKQVQKDRGLLLKEIEERLNNVRMLYKMGRVKEALAYLYVTYTEIAQFKHGIIKESSQTTTEFAIVMVKQFGQNPQNIYPFIQEIEQVIYGGYPYNEQVFMHAVQLFGQIYLELMEKPLPSFQLS